MTRRRSLAHAAAADSQPPELRFTAAEYRAMLEKKTPAGKLSERAAAALAQAVAAGRASPSTD